MPSTIIDPVGDALKDLIAGLGVTPSVKAYFPPVAMPDKLPAAMIQPPAFRRTGIEEAESQQGAEDWTLRYGVSFYFDLSNAATAQDQGIEIVEVFVAAVDDANRQAGSTLAALTEDVKVTEGEPDYSKIADRKPVFIYDCTVETLKLVAQ